MTKEKDLKLDDGSGDEQAKPGKSKLIILIVAIVLLLGLAIGATVFFMLPDDNTAPSEEEVVEEVKLPASYIKLKPEFIVNFQVGTRQRFLQIFMEVMVYDQDAPANIERHLPLIRNNIIAFIGDQDFPSLRTPGGKQKLREDLKTVINTIMEKESGVASVEEVLFTNFVMQ